MSFKVQIDLTRKQPIIVLRRKYRRVPRRYYQETAAAYWKREAERIALEQEGGRP